MKRFARRGQPRPGRNRLYGSSRQRALDWYSELPVWRASDVTNVGIHNLSKTLKLETRDLVTLSHGLKFAPTPRRPTEPDSTLIFYDHHSNMFRLVQKSQRDDVKGVVEYDTTWKFLKPPKDYTESPVPYSIKPPLDGVETVLSVIRSRFAEKLTSIIGARNPLPRNLDTRAFKLIKSIRLNRSLVCKPADKNLGLTVMDADWYDAQCRSHLMDATVYEPVTLTDATKRQQSALARIQMLVKAAVDNQIFDQRVAPHFTTHPVGSFSPFYVIPKLHKTPVSTRPIAASHSTVTSAASLFVDRTLQPFVARIPTVLKDSRSLVRRFALHDTAAIPPCPIGWARWLFTADVASLYPSIPIRDGIRSVMEHLRRIPDSEPHKPAPITRRLVNGFLSAVLDNNVIIFEPRSLVEAPAAPDEQLPPSQQNNNNPRSNKLVLQPPQYFIQKQGTAMGTACAPALANIFMYETVDRKILERSSDPNSTTHIVRFYTRFIDDLFGIIDLPTGVDAIAFLTELFREYAPKLSFSVTASYTSVVFMDLVIKAAGPLWDWYGIPSTSVYQKPINRYLYIPYNSYHPEPTKRGFIASELKRYITFSSFRQDYEQLRSVFYNRLRARGYPPKFLDPIFVKASYADRYQLLGVNPDGTDNKEQPPKAKHGLDVSVSIFVLPYNPLSLEARPFVTQMFKALNSEHPKRIHGSTNLMMSWKRAPAFRDLLCPTKRPKPTPDEIVNDIDVIS